MSLFGGVGQRGETIQPITKSIFDLAYVRIPDPKRQMIFFKPFIAFVTILLVFYVLVFWPRGICDLSFSTGLNLEGEVVPTGLPEEFLIFNLLIKG